MSYADLDKEFGSGTVFRLRNDGESMVFIPVGEPVAKDNQDSQGNLVRVAVLPVITSNGIGAVILNKTQYRLIRPLIEILGDKAIKIVRHGSKGDINTYYTVSLVDVPNEITEFKEQYKNVDVAKLGINSFNSLVSEESRVK